MVPVRRIVAVVRRAGLWFGAAVVVAAAEPEAGHAVPSGARDARADAQLRVDMNLKDVPYRIVYETFREDNWELYIMNADGSGQANLTNTPQVDDLYPHVSPDGSKLCFVVDETVEGQRTRNLYLMGLDGTGRTKIADNAREGCWSSDGRRIAYLAGEFAKYTLTDYANKTLWIYDLRTGTRTEHPNRELHHLYNLCWSADGAWFLATVHGGMGLAHAILAFGAQNAEVRDLRQWGVGGCRPDLSSDGKRLAWGRDDETVMAGDIDLAGPEPKVTNARPVAHCSKGFEMYHADWSPDGKLVAFSYGPAAGEMVGQRAPQWNICVADLNGNWVPVTLDGRDNKEPDWVPLPPTGR